MVPISAIRGFGEVKEFRCPLRDFMDVFDVLRSVFSPNKFVRYNTRPKILVIGDSGVGKVDIFTCFNKNS